MGGSCDLAPPLLLTFSSGSVVLGVIVPVKVCFQSSRAAMLEMGAPLLSFPPPGGLSGGQGPKNLNIKENIMILEFTEAKY